MKPLKTSLATIGLTLLSFNSLAATFIDLSHDYSAKTLHWPGSRPFKITNTISLTKPTDISARDYASSEHAGTHMDAPNHFAKGHPGIDGIALSNLIGPAIKIDVSHEIKFNPDYQVTIKDFEKWETEHGKIAPYVIILISTGYGKHWPDMNKYAGIKHDAPNTQASLHFPGLDPQAAEWLIKKRKIKAIGIDTFSIDYGQTKTFESHQILARHDIPIFENVASMEKLPANNFVVFALPMKIKDGTGAPLRIVALIS